jgi:hypothetical protein
MRFFKLRYTGGLADIQETDAIQQSRDFALPTTRCQGDLVHPRARRFGSSYASIGDVIGHGQDAIPARV